jgi:hypothetical protein
MVKRAMDLLSQALYYRALCLARDHAGCALCTGHGPTGHRCPSCKAWLASWARARDLCADPVRYPASHSSGPPHVQRQGTGPPCPCWPSGVPTAVPVARCRRCTGCGCG